MIRIANLLPLGPIITNNLNKEEKEDILLLSNNFS